MRIILTGAGGFLGRELAAHLRARGHVVAGMVRHPAQRMADEDFVGDFLHLKKCESRFRDFAPEAFIHCGWAGVPVATRDLSSQMANVPATADLVALAMASGARVVMGIGTQAEYGLQAEPVREDAPTRPVSLYGISKLAAGAALLRMAGQHKARGIWARMFGLYGPRETAPSMLPWLAREFAKGAAPDLTACTQLWDYLHVRDAARVLCDLLESGEGVFNVASGHAPPLRDTVLLLRDLMAPGIEPRFGAVPFGPEQVHCLAADISRLKAATGWAPQISLEEGLAELALEALGGLAS